MIWRYLLSIAAAAGLTLAAGFVFYLEPLEILATFCVAVAVVFLVLTILRHLFRAMRRGWRRPFVLAPLFRQFVVILIVLAVSYWGGVEIFKRFDRDCRSDLWPHWYCF